MNTRSQLVADARQIAQHIGYTNLVNGLQPFERLAEKRQHEREELADALKNKSILHALHEAADILYYTACMDEQDMQGETRRSLQWKHVWAQIADVMRKAGKPDAFTFEQAEKAALAKYNWRASGKNNKNEAYELSLIAEAIGMEQ